MSEGSKPSVQEALWSTLSVRDQDEINRRFGPHSWSEEDFNDNEARVRIVDQAVKDLAIILHTTCPNPNREFALALTQLEEVAMWAQKAIENN